MTEPEQVQRFGMVDLTRMDARERRYRGIIILLLVATFFSVCMALVQSGKLADLQREVAHNCQGVVGSLDLTEWVSVCQGTERITTGEPRP